MKGRIAVAAVLAVVLCCCAIGAQCSVIYVTTSGSDSNNGLSWANAKLTIQAAITAAAFGDEVWAAAGTYSGTVTLKSGVGLYGGFDGTESVRDDRDWVSNITTINNAAYIVHVPSGVSTSTIIDGFTITGGNYYVGGGIICEGPATISHNIIRNNQAMYQGAGISCNANAVIINNLIKANSSSNGAAIYCNNCSPTIANNTIVGNTASMNGTICCGNICSATISSNIIANNALGIFVAGGGNPTLRNNCVYNNSSYNHSGISAGSGDLSMDPVFANYADGNYHLLFGSPCIDAGYDSDVMQDNDLDGNSRQIDILTMGSSTVDMGAYEFDDPTPPTTPVVTDDGDYTISLTTLHAFWTSGESESGIAEYQYAIGTTPGATDVKGWTTVETMEATATDLTLVHGQTYYFSVKAKNCASVWSSVGYSDGITCVQPVATVSANTSPMNRRAVGVYQHWYGTEFHNGTSLTDPYSDLLQKWNLGTIRCWGDNWAPDSLYHPYCERIYDHVTDNPAIGDMVSAFSTVDGAILGVDGFCDATDESDAALFWLVNMQGVYDSYGRADANDRQGAFFTYDSGSVTNDERAEWYDHDDTNVDSIFNHAKVLADTLEGRVTKRVYEIGNEVYGGLYATDIYWKVPGQNATRVSWGDGWLLPNTNKIVWTHGNTGENGNALYIGFPYKPWMINFALTAVGQNGSVVWQHQDSNGNWVSLDPTAAIVEGTNEIWCAPNLQQSDFLEVKNLQKAGTCNLFFLPSCDLGTDSNGDPVGYDPEDWDDHRSDAAFHTDWVRTQPSEIGGANVRKLYWLRAYASTPYTNEITVEHMHRYFPDPKMWLEECNFMSDTLKAADPQAEVFYSGLYYYWGGYLPDLSPGRVLAFRNHFMWYYLNYEDNSTNPVTYFRDKWDGLVIHPYVTGDSTSMLTRVDNEDYTNYANAGLLQRINAMRTLLNPDPELPQKKIACTEWGNWQNGSVTSSLAGGLYCLEGNIEMAKRHASGCNTVDYASWYFDIPSQFEQSSPFYTYPSIRETIAAQKAVGSAYCYPVASTNYIQRPVGLAMEMAANYYRAYAHDVTNSIPASDGKVYAFTESSKSATMVLINKKGTAQNYTFSWPAAAGKIVYKRVLQSTNGSLDASNETPGSPQVTLSDQQYVCDVAADGTFQITIPAYAAVGLEFKDN